MIECKIESIRVSLVTQNRVVILKEVDTERYLPIWIGPYEADAIALELQEVPVARPLTHDLLQSVIGELGATVTHVFINDLRDDTFFARIVLDVRMEPMSGLQVHDALVARGSGVPVLFLTGHGDIPMAVEAVKKGAYDFIEKPFDDYHLLCQVLNAIEDAADAAPAPRPPADGRDERLAALTQREREVLRRVLEGKSSRQIGEELFVSSKTVDFHRARIMQKLGVRTREQLYALFRRR